MKKIVEEYHDGYAMVEKWCHYLTEAQTYALMFVLDNGGFLGIGHSLNNVEHCPMIATGLTNTIYVINSKGHYELAAANGRVYYSEK